jgi:hypothetical protein
MRPYKPTGNASVDMVAACINHCQRFGKQVASIHLEGRHWLAFTAFVKAQIPGYDLGNGTVDFDGVEVSRGSSLQVKPLYYELATPQHAHQ